MKRGKTRVLILFTAGIMTLATFGQAQESRQPRGDRNPVDRIAEVLEAAGCPLSADQIETLEDADSERGILRDILTEEQRKALAAKRSPRKQNGKLHGAMNRILEDAGCPLTDGQIAEMKELERGPGIREEIANILTGEQKQALESAKEKARDPETKLEHISAILEKAGYPLSATQMDAIRDIDPDGDVRTQMGEILTDEQKQAMKKPGRRHGGHHALRGIATILKEAGQPLTEEQLAQIKAGAKDPEARVKIREILTDAQKEILAEARENRPEGKGHRHPVRLLEEAGCPLTEEQREALRDMSRDTDRHEAFLNILTNEQKNVLDEAIGNSGDPSLEKATAIEEKPAAITVLKQNFPNPFNPTTTINYSLAEAGPVTIEVFNSQGQLVATLAEGHQSAGHHTMVWDASRQAVGVYMCRMTSGGATQSRSMTLVK